MDRLFHLRETLPVNIEENEKYPHVEFVLLDYNSRDGLEDWVRSTMAHHIGSGRLKYYRTYDPQTFALSHSKNMALRLGTGEIRCLLDADNYAGPGYAAWINEVFDFYGPSAVVTTLRENAVPYGDQGGKLAFHKDAIYTVNGFDESLVGYGIEDVDLVNRMQKSGKKRIFINDDVYLKFIAHSNAHRVKNHAISRNLAELFFQITSNMNKRNRVLYAMKDNSFLDITYEHDSSLKSLVFFSHGGWVIKNSLKGNYEREGNDIHLTYVDGTRMDYRMDATGAMRTIAANDKTLWKRIPEDEKMYIQMQLAYSECMNRAKYVENDQKNYNSVNPDGWGRGRVFRNFDTATPIDLD